jgi:acyl-coenzyme A synthetase/AMP-(fatty) acid ligase
MRTIREYDVVRVTRLLGATRWFTGTESVARAPAVGDVAIVCHEYQPDDPTARVAVEMVDQCGATIWLADFERSELELVDATAV